MCTGKVQLCDPRQGYAVETKGVLRVRFEHGKACSKIKLHLFLGNVEHRVTGPIGANQVVTYDFGPLPAGRYQVLMQAEGVVGGCNYGVLGLWGGKLTITTSR